jgi:hypothetical protein
MGHDPAGFRLWWRRLTGSDETLDNNHRMRLAGRFSRRVRAYAKAHPIPVMDCGAGERKHNVAEEHLKTTRVKQGLFLVLVGRAQARVLGCGKERSHRAEETDAVRKPLLLSHPGPGLGAHHDQAQRPSSISSPSDGQRT